MKVAPSAPVGRWGTLIPTSTLIRTLMPTHTRTLATRATRRLGLATSATRSTPFTSKLFLRLRLPTRMDLGTNTVTLIPMILPMIILMVILMIRAGTCRRFWL